jgi:hypothetical protein
MAGMSNLRLMNIYKRILDSKYGLILLLITISLIVGLFIVDDFGLSWDEYKDLTYGDLALDAYRGSEDFLWYGLNRKLYGPFYWMFVSLTSKFVDLLGVHIHFVDVWKYIGYLSFQLASLSFFLLYTRFMKRSIAFLTTLLFSLQPLLFGHAFINTKDIPFMAFFLTSVVLGLKGVDIVMKTLDPAETSGANYLSQIRPKLGEIRGRWEAASRTTRIALTSFSLILLFSILELFFLQRLIFPFLENVLRAAYEGSAPELINSLFQKIAQDAFKSEVNLYLEKLQAAYALGRVFVVIALVLAISWIGRGILFEGRLRGGIGAWLKAHRVILLSGLLLGLTNSIRIAAPLAGGLVSLYFIVKAKHRALFPLIAYWGIGLAVTYMTWPYLWGSPLDRLIESVNASTAFIQRETLFQGTIINATQMPWFYLPKMMAIQFTEPVLGLFLVGVYASAVAFRRDQEKKLEFLMLLIWGVLPLAAVILMRVPVYDNFRQFFFLMPPFFVICGIGLTKIMSLIKDWQLKTLVVAVILLPGLIGIINLHPFEYIYYNTLVEGVDGAYQTYELDYWCTSLRESVEHINRVASPNPTVVVAGPITAAQPRRSRLRHRLPL